MIVNFFNAALELAKVEASFYCRDIRLVSDSQRTYTARRILCLLAGFEAPFDGF